MIGNGHSAPAQAGERRTQVARKLIFNHWELRRFREIWSGDERRMGKQRRIGSSSLFLSVDSWANSSA